MGVVEVEEVGERGSGPGDEEVVGEGFHVLDNIVRVDFGGFG